MTEAQHDIRTRELQAMIADMDDADTTHLRADTFPLAFHADAIRSHCPRCARAVPLLWSESLAIAQLALWTIAEHHLTHEQLATMVRRINDRLSPA